MYNLFSGEHLLKTFSAQFSGIHRQVGYVSTVTYAHIKAFIGAFIRATGQTRLYQQLIGAPFSLPFDMLF